MSSHEADGRIHAKLTESLSPVTLTIKDESFMHGSPGNPSGIPSGDAFKVLRERGVQA